MKKRIPLTDSQRDAFNDLRELFQVFSTPMQRGAYVELMSHSLIQESIDYMIRVVRSALGE